MKNSKIVEEQYLNLKNKVQNQIKALQEKLSKNSTIRYHRSLSSKIQNLNIPSYNGQNYQSKQKQKQHRHHHHCCHSHQCHSHHHNHNHHYNQQANVNCSSNSCSKNNSFRCQQNSKDHILQNIVPTNLNTSRAKQTKQDKQNNQSTRLLKEALTRSLQNQKELAQNLRLLNQKIQKLSQSKSARHSQIQQNHLNISGVNHFCSTNSKSSSNIRTKSQQNQVNCNPVLKQYQRQNNFMPQIGSKSKISQQKRNKLKRPEKNVSNHDIQYLYHIRSQKRLKTPSLQTLKNQKEKSVSKKSQNLGHQYFGGQNLCPIHSKPQVGLISAVDKQIYKDAQHRNRKHERDHLLQSFRQQEIGRKKLISKITQNGFHNYGAK